MSFTMLLLASMTVTSHLKAATHSRAHVRFAGMYVEGCSCAPPCPCEIVGLSMGCQGVGGFSIASGEFDGADLSGVKFAYATTPGDWVVCYVDAPTASKRAAGAALAKAAFGGWGKMGPVKDASIAIHGSGGTYTLSVNGGRTMSLTTKPFFGLDKTKPITYSNINSVMHPKVMQAKTVSCTFHDGDKAFHIKGTNAYYNPALKVNGALGAGG
jgi:hypothetical protein